MIRFVIVLILALIIGSYFYFHNSEKKGVCEIDEDCVPATCCHADSCVLKSEAPNCDGAICTMSCSGPMDCGAGSCGCNKGKCEVRTNEAG